MTDESSQDTISTDSPSAPVRAKFNFWRWFWLSTIPVSIGWVWYDFYAPSNHVTWAKDYASAEQAATKSGKPMILFFTGEWCSPCRIMKRTVWADQEVENTVNARFIPVMIDVDNPKSASISKRYHVVATPTTIITDSHGTAANGAMGGIGKSEFLGLLSNPKPSQNPRLSKG